MDSKEKHLVTRLYDKQQELEMTQVAYFKSALENHKTLEARFKLLGTIVDIEDSKLRKESVSKFKELLNEGGSRIKMKDIIARSESQLEHFEAETQSLLSEIDTTDDHE